MKAKKIICRISLLAIIMSLFACSQGPAVFEKPQNVRAGIIGSSGVVSGSNTSRLVFSWDPVSGASGYTVYKLSTDNKATAYADAGSKTYVINKSYTSSDFAKDYAVQGTANGKPTFMTQLTVYKNKYYGEMKGNPKNNSVEWTKFPESTNYLVVSADTTSIITNSNTKPADYLSSTASGSVFTTTSCSISSLSLDESKSYAVYVFMTDADKYLRMTEWRLGSNLINEASATGTTPGTTTPETGSSGVVLPVNDLDFDKYTIGTSPHFHLTWSSVQNATTYKVYAAVVMDSENASIMTDTQLTSSSKWTLVGQSSSNSYDVYFSQVSSLLTKWQQLPNNNSCVVYFKVESYNSTYGISGGLGKVCNFVIPKESYSYPCTYTVRDAASYGVNLKVLRIDSHTYKLIWDKPTSYYAIAYRDGGTDYTYWNAPLSSENAVRASNYQANSKYEFMLCRTLNDPATRVSNKVLCEF